MSTVNESTDVTIVGGGPSGLLSALLLARLGIASIVLERNAFTEEHPKAHELNARSIEILRDVGITEEELATEASPLEDASRIQFCRTINEEIGHIDLLADPQRKEKYKTHLKQTLPYMNISQSEFEKILVRHVHNNPLIDLRFGHKWEGFDEESDTVKSYVNHGSASYAITSAYLLGCDGASSRVRKACGIDVDGPTNIQSFVNAYFQLNLRDHVDVAAKLYWILHPEFAGTFIAHHMEKRWVYAVPVSAPWERPEDFSAEIMKARIRGAMDADLPDLEITSLSTWHMTAQVAQSYRHGRALLVGDAAHRFPPTGGLGMNTGIGDAHNLCWKLASVITRESEDAILDTYEQERRPVAVENCAESHRNFEKIWEVIEALGMNRNGPELLARLMGSAPIKWLPQSARDRIRWLITRPPLWIIGKSLKNGPRRDRVAKSINDQIGHFDRLGLDIGYQYQAGALIEPDEADLSTGNSVSEYIPSTNPGARLPHAWATDDAHRSTHDCLSYELFTLFVPSSFCASTTPGVDVVESTPFPPHIFSSADIILVRPDGHVAWRTTVNDYSEEKLLEVLNKVRSSTAALHGEIT